MRVSGYTADSVNQSSSVQRERCCAGLYPTLEPRQSGEGYPRSNFLGKFYTPNPLYQEQTLRLFCSGCNCNATIKLSPIYSCTSPAKPRMLWKTEGGILGREFFPVATTRCSQRIAQIFLSLHRIDNRKTPRVFQRGYLHVFACVLGDGGRRRGRRR